MSDVPDKQQLYGDYRDSQKARSKLAMKAAHKALDIPEDDVQINQTTTTNGISGKALAFIAAGLGVPGAVLAYFLMQRPSQATPEPPTAPVATQQEYIGVYEQRQPDGTWKVIKREPLR